MPDSLKLLQQTSADDATGQEPVPALRIWVRSPVCEAAWVGAQSNETEALTAVFQNRRQRCWW